MFLCKIDELMKLCVASFFGDQGYLISF